MAPVLFSSLGKRWRRSSHQPRTFVLVNRLTTRLDRLVNVMRTTDWPLAPTASFVSTPPGNGEAMVASQTYELFRQAMAERKQVVCTYQGFRREVCPVILGLTGGREKALTFQFAGGSSKPLPPRGQWRCLTLEGVTDVELREGRWHSGADHGAAQTCVTEVHYDVNPESPYNPTGKL
jgi:hypothetical protein